MKRGQTSMTCPVDYQMLNMSEFYTGIYTQPAPQQGSAKPRRRRKKNERESGEGVLRKRKLTEEQVNLLELNFGSEHKLETERKDRLATKLGLDPRQVAVWFQNRRARWKAKNMEEEYFKLKAEHESTMVEKCHLETELLKLKEKLANAEKEIGKLFEKHNRVSSTSPCSSFSMEVMRSPFLGDFEMEGMGNIFYVPDYAGQEIDWVNLYM